MIYAMSIYKCAMKPAEQLKHWVPPLEGKNVPTSHWRQSEALAVTENEPAGHCAHSKAPVPG
jgi:hypothetical protein